MKVIIKGKPEEIAALVVTIQERRQESITISLGPRITEEDRIQLVDLLLGTLGTSSAQDQTHPATEKTLPGGNQEGFKEDVKEALISLLTSESIPVEYK